MRRRSFLKSLGAIGLLPSIPVPSLAGSVVNAAPAVPAATYKWAEMIVRAHNTCNLSMLERLLQLDPAAASAVRGELMRNGVISGTANQYGMHRVAKPLWEGAFPKSHSAPAPVADPQSADPVSRRIEADNETPENPELTDALSESSENFDRDFNALNEEPESEAETVESVCEGSGEGEIEDDETA